MTEQENQMEYKYEYYDYIETDEEKLMWEQFNEVVDAT